jgi:hypothetical protein
VVAEVAADPILGAVVGGASGARGTVLLSGLPADVAQRLDVDRKCTKQQLARALVRFGADNIGRSNVYFLRIVCAASESVHYSPPKRSVIEALLKWAEENMAEDDLAAEGRAVPAELVPSGFSE